MRKKGNRKEAGYRNTFWIDKHFQQKASKFTNTPTQQIVSPGDKTQKASGGGGPISLFPQWTTVSMSVASLLRLRRVTIRKLHDVRLCVCASVKKLTYRL